MTLIKVADMHCEKCVERITRLVTEGGVECKVSLEDKTVTEEGCEHCVKTAMEALDDLGYSAEV